MDTARDIRVALLAIAAAFLVACSLSQTEQARLEAWLMCQECVAGELDSVRAMGDDAVDFLRETLREADAQATESVRVNSGVVWSRLPNPATESASYVDRMVSNFQASLQKRAAVGLGAIATTASTEALREALADHDIGVVSYRPDVLATIYDAVYLGTGRVEWAAASAGRDHSCGVATNGRAFCWGSANDWRLGLGVGESGSVPLPTRVSISALLDSVSADSNHTCALARDRRAYCWGDGARGELGYGGTDDRSRPVPVAAPVAFVAVYAGGGNFSCGLAADGDAYCWGDNGSGQLGISQAPASQSTPAPVGGGLTFTALSVSRGGNHTCGLTDAGRAYCWGTSDDGALGTGTTTADTPEPVQGLEFTAIDAGFRHTCGIASGTGRIYCWGNGEDGRLGNGSNQSSATPVPVGPVSPGGPPRAFVAVSAGLRHSCAITTAGVAYCWGYGLDGQLGNGESGIRNTPVLVVGGHLWRTVTAADHSCGITVDNLLYCWGPGGFGEIGDSGIENRFEPTEVTFPPNR